MIGVITNRRIGKNRDGSVDKVILQVEIIKDEDVRTVELFSQSGEDVNPANGCRVNIINIIDSYYLSAGISDDLQPECNPGEREIYSTDNPVTMKKARLKCKSNGELLLNNGTDYAVKHSELNTILQTFVTALNSILASKVDGSGSAGTLTLNLTNAKSATVRIP